MNELQTPGPGCRRRPLPRLSLWLIATTLLTGSLSGCTSLPGAPEDGGISSAAVAHHPASSQVMVILETASSRELTQKIRELERRHRLRTVVSWEMASLGVHCVVFQSLQLSVSFMVKQLKKDPRISLVQEVQWFRVLEDPPAAASEDPYRHLQQGAEVIHLDRAHSRSTGRGIRIAVIDTGVDVSHPDLQDRVLIAKNFVRAEESRFTQDVHGTAVSGVIAASTGNGVGITGVAPEASIMALKACWPSSRGSNQAVCNTYTLALALDFAIVQGAQIINLSLAGPEDPILRQLIERSIEQGIVIIAAVDDGGGNPFPASLPAVVAVRSLGSAETNDPDGKALEQVLTAPGLDVLSTVPEGGYDFFSGSSFAAAHVSGVAALVLQLRPKMTPEALGELLFDTAGENPGHAVVDAWAAVERASSGL